MVPVLCSQGLRWLSLLSCLRGSMAYQNIQSVHAQRAVCMCSWCVHDVHGCAEVWPLEMDSFDSVRSFAERLGSWSELAKLPFQPMTKAKALVLEKLVLDMLLHLLCWFCSFVDWFILSLALPLLFARRYIESIGTHDTQKCSFQQLQAFESPCCCFKIFPRLSLAFKQSHWDAKSMNETQ